MNAVTASEIRTEDLVYPQERVLGAVTLVLGLLGWLALIVGTFGVARLCGTPYYTRDSARDPGSVLRRRATRG
jgi:hypothetical protein